MKSLRDRFLAILTLVGLLCLAPAAADLARAQPDPSLAAVSAQVDAAEDQLRALGQTLRAEELSDDVIKARLAALAPLQAGLAADIDQLTPRLADTDLRLSQLGPAPRPGQPPEDAETASTRAALVRVRASLDGEIKQARLLSVEGDQLGRAFSDRLRRNFTARLWAQSRSVLDPILWRDFLMAVPADAGRLAADTAAEAQQLAAAAAQVRNIVIWSVAGVVAALLLGPARLALRWATRRRVAAMQPTAFTRSALAVWRVLVAGLTPLLAGLLLHAALRDCDALTDVFDQLAGLLVRIVVFAAVMEGLGRAVLSPGAPDWRLAPIHDEAVVARLARATGLIAIAAAVATFVSRANGWLGAGLATSVATECFTLLVELAAVGAGLTLLARARNAETAETAEASGAETRRLPWVLAAMLAWLAIVSALAAVVLGYLALAIFLTRETVWIALVLCALFVLLRFTDELFPLLLAPTGPIGRLLRNAVGLSAHALEQLGVLLAGLMRLALLLFGWSAILAPFGASAADIIGRVTSTKVAIHLGQVSISPGAVLGGVGLFLLGLAITRAVRGWLEARYLPKTRMDVGVRTSVATGVTYLGAIIALLLAFEYLGLSFSQIALVASALSVGIGFGLQSIISNFVSGLILLAERPVKVGDWIAIGDLEGDVRRINIRATEIEMMDKSRLIVPNSDLISKTVRNVTFAGALGRVRIILRVADVADPVTVRELILARLRAHGEVLHDPAPSVYLTDVRDGALELTAFAYLASARLAYRVKSELLFQIVADLKSAGVALANSTPVVNVGLPDRPIEPSPAPPAGPEAPAA